MREGHQGTGPGAITPDGCAVELYSRLPAGAKPDIVAAAVPRGARILELGSGVGRMTHPLLERGFAVTAVDESAEMLEHVRGARTICGPIEDLDLGESFDVVMLASFLVHTGDAEVSSGLLRTCARHVAEDGCVLIQREGEDCHTNLPRERDGPQRLHRAHRVVGAGRGRQVNAVHAEYEIPGRGMDTDVPGPAADQGTVRGGPGEAGLGVDRYLTDDGTWVRGDSRGPEVEHRR